MKRYEKLGLLSASVDINFSLRILKSRLEHNPDAEYDKAQKKRGSVFAHQLVALTYVLQDENDEACKHGRLCLQAAEEFFLGDWRHQYRVNDGKDDPDPAWWKKHLIWMDL